MGVVGECVMVVFFLGGFFFLKQKTAYEFTLGLVGSEMCIRDGLFCVYCGSEKNFSFFFSLGFLCPLYTSDPAHQRIKLEFRGSPYH